MSLTKVLIKVLSNLSKVKVLLEFKLGHSCLPITELFIFCRNRLVISIADHCLYGFNLWYLIRYFVPF